jgi:hypothetical protein
MSSCIAMSALAGEMIIHLNGILRLINLYPPGILKNFWFKIFAQSSSK